MQTGPRLRAHGHRRDERGSVRRHLPQALFEDLPFGEDPWRLVAAGGVLARPQLPPVMALGNGFIGVRGPGDKPGAPRVYLNGVYERVPIPYHEAAFGYARESDTRLAVADATRPGISVDGEGEAVLVRAELDMARGGRIETVEIGGVTLTIETLVSMHRPGIVALRIAAPAGAAARIQVAPHVAPPPDAGEEAAGTAHAPDPTAPTYDPRLAPGFVESPWRAVSAEAGDGFARRVDRLAASGFTVAALAALAPVAIRDGRALFDMIVSYAATRDDTAPIEARAALAHAQAAGFDALAREQADWFAAHWEASAIALPAAPRAEQAVRHALFELVQAVGRDGRTSIGAKGQTGEGYEGHVFWDADLYVLPVFAFTRPDIARAMLAWRIAGLEAARENARAMGQRRGALYPWRTIGGRECSSFFPAGSAQYHINADIAFALQTYVQATGDRTILAEGGAAMLVETARIWLEIGFHDPARGDAFIINRVTGPDEYSAIVDNNLYTNMMAARHLRFAAREGATAGLVDAQEAARMRRAADMMLLPHDAARGIYLQDEGFFGKQPWPFETTPRSAYPLLLHHHPLLIYRHQVAKQADAVLAIALMPERFDADTRRRMLDAYEAVTVHDSTLSASAFATAAARCGEGARAAEYWRVAALTDLADLFGNSDHGLHMAALAGSWSALVMGFAGLHVEGERLCFDPLPLPGSGPCSFTVAFRGSRITVTIEAAQARYALEDGDPVALRHGGTDAVLGPQPLRMPLA